MTADATAFLTTTEAAKVLRVHVRTLRRWIRAGRLPIVKVGAVVRVPALAIEALAKAGQT
jgi:excisionase family DNA binding protein